MQTTDAQVRKLMEEYAKHGKLEGAARRSEMSRWTARRYIELGKLPSELKKTRDWRTRPDPFAEDWDDLAARLRDAPELEAKTLFDVLCEEHPDRYADGQLRTLQRRVKAWRATHGPDQEVVLAQRHRAGEAAQTDFTSTAELGVTIAGQAFNCCDGYISEWEVAQLAKQVAGSMAEIGGRDTSAKNTIVTDKLQTLGMKFGGRALLETTVRALVQAARE